MSKRGRQSKFLGASKNQLRKAYRVGRDPHTTIERAKIFGVDRTTLDRWIVKPTCNFAVCYKIGFLIFKLYKFQFKDSKVGMSKVINDLRDLLNQHQDMTSILLPLLQDNEMYIKYIKQESTNQKKAETD
jgi:hypothetical protein